MTVKSLVIDTSVAVKWFLPEEGTERSLRLLRRIETGEAKPLAPDLIYAEFANVIWKRVVRDGMDPKLGGAMISQFQEVPIEAISSASLSLVAFDLACRYRRSAYDCLFLALSLSANVPLVTADELFYNAVKPNFPKVVRLSSI